MISILVALAATASGLLMGSLILRGRTTVLKVKEQSYRFHELRDRLQLLLLDGEVEAGSVPHAFLMDSLNLAIRNAGVMRLSQVLDVSRAVKTKADSFSYDRLIKEVHRSGKGTQKLYEEFFEALVEMLVSNDHLTLLMFSLWKLAVRELGDAAVKAVIAGAKWLFPEQTEAIRDADQYKQLIGKVHAFSY